MINKILVAVLFFPWISVLSIQADAQNRTTAQPHPDLFFIDTNFENASPLYWDTDVENNIHIYLVYDHERRSPNRANGHWFFQLQARKGSDLTLILHNFDNVWNGKYGSPVSDKTICYISTDGKKWRIIPTEFLPENAIRFHVQMETQSLYVARVQPYRLSDLQTFLGEIKNHPLVHIETIGKTVEGRDLEIVRIGDPKAPYRVLVRARAHAWEPGGNWVIQGIADCLLDKSDRSRKYLQKYCVFVMPMANKDGVAHGRTRFTLTGMDLNRQWDQPADPVLCPENHALESWLKTMITKGQKPHLAIDFHNDEGGRMHISRPNINLKPYLKRMKLLEELMVRHSWFTEGSTGSSFRNPGTIGEGLLERFGIDAVVQELNCNWIAGLDKPPTGKDWELFGRQLCEVWYRYFDTLE